MTGTRRSRIEPLSFLAERDVKWPEEWDTEEARRTR
jgi:hypothetical protein